MRCPFLREAQVKSCCASPFKKMIVRTSAPATSERCSGADWITCPAAKQHHQDRPAIDRCPFLQESLVQYCSAVSAPKYIPYSEASLSRCGTESHSYCEVFLTASGSTAHIPSTDAHSVPVEFGEGMFFSRNHLWMNVHADHTCHIGIDAFLAQVLFDVKDISFITLKGTCCPSAVLSVRSANLQVTFPSRIQVTRVNTYLRARPESITAHPYTTGWLFEGIETGDGAGTQDSVNHERLFSGKRAQQWMAQESRRLAYFVHNELLSPHTTELVTMTDGGLSSHDLIMHLQHDEIVRLFDEFFSTPPELPSLQRNLRS